MLQFNKTQSAIDRELAAPEIVSVADTLRHFVSFVRRQFPVIAFMTLLVTALGVIYLITARPSFTAHAQLLIDARKVQIFQQQSIFNDIPIDTTQVESQVEVLKSENIALSVIKNLRLTEDPEFAGSGGGLLGMLLSFISSPFESDHAASEFELIRHAVGAFQARLSIKRIGLTYVIQIGFRSYDAERAAEVANALADAYIVDQLEAKYQATRRASVWLHDRIKELRDQVSVAERAVVEFKAKHNIVSTGGSDKRLIGEQQVAELNSQLVIARANTAEVQARLDRIQAVLKAGSTNASVDATLTDTLKSQIVQTLRGKYLELAARESDWSARYGRNHLAVVSLRTQMHEIRNSIFEELKRLGETYKSDYEIAKQREEGVRKELTQAVSLTQTTDTAQIAARELESTAQTYKTLYNNFLQRYMESVQQQSFPITEARLISSATRPLSKSDPIALRILAIAGLGGMILGFGLGALRDLSDRVFRTSEQVDRLLQTDCIGLVPLLAGEGNPKTIARDQSGSGTGAKSLLSHVAEVNGSASLVSDMHGTNKSTTRSAESISPRSAEGTPMAGVSPSPGKVSTSVGPRTIVRGDNAAHWTIVDAPLSRFAESIRSIKLAVDLDGAGKASQVIGFTSSLPNEGKSTVATALAQLMSQAGLQTILIDCDLRNPSISRSLTPNAKIGWLEIVTGKASLEEVIWKDPSTNMTFLPAVVKSRLTHHSREILSSPPTIKLFEQLRQKYNYVIVDCSPLAPIVDVRGMVHLTDSFVFVIEWGGTKIDLVEHALGNAQGIYKNLLGVVLNKVDMNLFGRYSSQYENYYFNQYHARYGYTE